jgi:hypothetical protein
MIGRWLYKPLGLLAVIGLITFLGCSSNSSTALKRALSPNTIAILTDAEELEAYRIDFRKIDLQKKDDPGVKICRFPVKGKRTTQGSEFAARLGTSLLQNSSVHETTWDEVHANVKHFDPSVAFRFKRGGRTVDVALDFVRNNLDIQPNRLENAIGIELADFTSKARPTLLALTKEAFPDDAEIQAIAEK